MPVHVFAFSSAIQAVLSSVNAGGTETLGIETRGATPENLSDNTQHCLKLREMPIHDGQVNSIVWTTSVGGGTALFHFAIYNHDAANDLPSTVVANSQSTEISVTNTSVAEVTFNYTTKPSVVSGTQYWLCVCNSGNANPAEYYTNTAGTRIAEKAITYETYPDWAGSGSALDDALGDGKFYIVTTW